MLFLNASLYNTNNMSVTLQAKHTWHFFKTGLLQALPTSILEGRPADKLQIYGITGTDGKTTSSTLLYHVLKTAGYKVALISTVAAYIGDREIDTGFHVTSPQPAALQRILKQCVDEGIEHVVLEVTSHGFFQYRVWQIPFALAGVTNVSPEHLDYFEDWETLARVKGSFLAQAKHAVLNADDRSYRVIQPIVKQQNTAFTPYQQQSLPGKMGQAIKARFPQLYNQWNANLVWTMAQKVGVTEKDFIAAVESFPGVKGRMEFVETSAKFEVVVDFAHTPNALEQALTALRPVTKKRLIAVFGCAGLRDRQKRPLMGGIGARLADVAIFTAEDPRTENIQVILRQMKEGVIDTDFAKIVSIPDRRDAIHFALQQARPGDVVGIFGKGHEKSMCYGTVEQPWSDQEVVKEELKRL